MNNSPEKQANKKKAKGFLNPKIVRAVTFYIISACIVFSVAVCILAIWNYAKTDVFWRMIATLGMIAIGSAVFAFVNGIFGVEEE
jgi:nucleoside recognition membrane protein YjiH